MVVDVEVWGFTHVVHHGGPGVRLAGVGRVLLQVINVGRPQVGLSVVSSSTLLLLLLLLVLMVVLLVLVVEVM